MGNAMMASLHMPGRNGALARWLAALLVLLALAAPLAAQEAASGAAAGDAAKAAPGTADTGASSTRAQPVLPADPALKGAVEEAKAAAGRAERKAAEAEQALAKIRVQVERPDVDEKTLQELRERLIALSLQLLAERKQLAAPLSHMRQQLSALGPAPKEAGAEDPDISAKRTLLSQMVQRLEAADRQLELLIVQARQLAERAAERQRALFFSEVFKPARSVLNPLLWVDGLATLPDFWQRFTALLSGWLRQEGRVGILVALGLLLASLVAVAQLWRQWRGPWEAREKPADEVRRLWQAVRVPLFVAAITFALLALIKLALFTLGAPSPRVERVLTALAGGVMYAAVLIAMARGILRPRTPHMRLVDIGDAGAMRAYRLIILIAVLHGLDLFLTRLAAELFLPVAFSEAWAAAMALTHVGLVWMLVLTLRRARGLAASTEEGATPQEADVPGRFLFGWVRYVFHVILLLLVVIVVALLAGYISLAHFIARQMVFTAALVSALYLLHHLADALVKSAFDPRSPVGRFLRQDLLFSENAIARASVTFSTLVDVATVLVGLPLVLMQWAVNWIDVLAWVRQVFFGFKVGNITIEPANILLGLIVFMIGLVLVRLLVMWLDRRVLSRSDMDEGIRHSILTVSRYTGIVGAFLVALSVAGVNLTSLAFFGGALGIGIGFGLQTIVNNFVSGLILLAERPIKAGDWIQVSGGEGVVKRIKVRSTEIETFDRCTIIVPNSQLISEPVSNWFHDNRMGRVRIPVGVSYDADPDEVREILLKCAKAHPRTLASPAPFVLFTGFGDNSLDFELRLYIGDAGYRASTASDLRFTIFRELKKAGIEIPFPQRDVHLRSLPPEMFDRGESLLR